MPSPTSLQTVFDQIKPLLQAYQPPFAPKRDEPGYYDLWSFKDMEVLGRKRKEMFFAGLIVFKNHVGFYYMPVYTDDELKTFFSPEMLKLLKGKSCFHIKKVTPELLAEIDSALKTGLDLYRSRGWLPE